MYAEEYIEYLVHFHGDRDYFECHEVLEEYWKKIDKNNKQSILVAFILLAVSNYHHRRNNFPGAARTLTKALQLFSNEKEQLVNYGFEPNSLFPFLKERLLEIKKKQSYRSMILPIHDPLLLKECKNACKEKGLNWGMESDLTNKELVHKHKMRNRLPIIEQRIQSLEKRRGKD